MARRAVLSFALGVIVAIATAWTCAMVSSFNGAPSVIVQGVFDKYGNVDPNPQVLPMRGFGVKGTNTFVTFAGVDPSTGNQYIAPTPVDQRIAFGWPVSALSYHVVRAPEAPRTFLLPKPTKLWMTEKQPNWLVGGLSGLKGTTWRGVPGRHFPLMPRPVGLLADTLIAATPLYILLGGWMDIRAFARVRRGRCSRCGYDARGLPTCPECGLETPRSLWRAIRDFFGRSRGVLARGAHDGCQGLQILRAGGSNP